MLDKLLHAIGGAVLALLVLKVPFVGVVLVMTFWGYMREGEQQHCRGINTRWQWHMFSLHKHLEALAWGVGALVVQLVLLLL